MSIEKPSRQEESPDSMKAFREEVRHLMQEEIEKKEKGIQGTGHFLSIKNAEEFVNSLNEDDMQWFNFVKEATLATGKDRIHTLSSTKAKEYQEKIEEFKQVRDIVKGFRSDWYEFLANKLNVLGMAIQLSFLEAKRGKNDLLR